MQFNAINENRIFIGKVDAITAILPDIGFYPPKDIKVSLLGSPPTNELNKWYDNGTKWIRVTADYIIQIYDAAVEKRLNDWAIQHQYMSSDRLLKYENSTIPKWKFEATNFRVLWDNTWLWLQNYLNQILASGSSNIPTWEELEALLNTNVPLVWPEYNE